MTMGPEPISRIFLRSVRLGMAATRRAASPVRPWRPRAGEMQSSRFFRIAQELVQRPALGKEVGTDAAGAPELAIVVRLRLHEHLGSLRCEGHRERCAGAPSTP